MAVSTEAISGYVYSDAKTSHAHAYLLPALRAEIANASPSPKRAFDLGCGNGSVAAHLSKDGWDIEGVDVSEEGIAQANQNYPKLKLRKGSAYDDLAEEFGQFPVVYSLEVVEHVYGPRDYASTLFDLVAPGGTAIISTPYHGYWKNLALAVTGKMDAHFTALWDHGHIKFWSIKTLSELLKEAGFTDIRYVRVGRIPILAKSMIAIAKKPGVEGPGG